MAIPSTVAGDRFASVATELRADSEAPTLHVALSHGSRVHATRGRLVYQRFILRGEAQKRRSQRDEEDYMLSYIAEAMAVADAAADAADQGAVICQILQNLAPLL